MGVSGDDSIPNVAGLSQQANPDGQIEFGPGAIGSQHFGGRAADRSKAAFHTWLPARPAESGGRSLPAEAPPPLFSPHQAGDLQHGQGTQHGRRR